MDNNTTYLLIMWFRIQQLKSQLDLPNKTCSVMWSFETFKWEFYYRLTLVEMSQKLFSYFYREANINTRILNQRDTPLWTNYKNPYLLILPILLNSSMGLDLEIHNRRLNARGYKCQDNLFVFWVKNYSKEGLTLKQKGM